MKYLPFLTGTYTTAPGLTPMAKADGRDKLFFQIDDTYEHYIENKRECRRENIRKYFCEHKLNSNTIKAVNQFIANQLVLEYPQQFIFQSAEEKIELTNTRTNEILKWTPDWQAVENKNYLSLLDALCSQAQEDLAIFQLQDTEDYLSAIHLCSPNHWAPSDKIGKPFSAIHAPVPAMERTLLHYQKMLSAIVNTHTASTRFAWGIATDTRLNHHPEAPPGIEQHEWDGRKHDENTTWYVRSERQNLIGLPEVNAFLFTIRTYFYKVDELLHHEKLMLLSAVKSMSQDTLRYKGLTDSVGLLEEKLSE